MIIKLREITKRSTRERPLKKREYSADYLYHAIDYKIRTFFDKYGEKLLFILACALSITSFLYFYSTRQNLADYDAMARLNIARKIVDSITPGIGQLGGIWLPFPQILLIPFITNNFLWHSGLAGSLISMSAFVVSSIFIYKTAFLITKKRFSSFLVWFVFVTNINLLLLQTMAMSESFFLFGMIMAFYFLTLWSMKRDLVSLLYAGVAIILITLTRYEGYFIFIGAFVTVTFISSIAYAKKQNFKKMEGVMLFFGTVSSYGIVLWCLYCALFYKDPLYWFHLYTGPKGQIITSVLTNSMGVALHAKGYFDSFVTYSEAMVWMNGIIITIVGVAGFISLVKATITSAVHKGSYMQYLPLVLNGIILYLFLIYGYQKDLIPDITTPPLSFSALIHKSLNYAYHSNIRYGTVMVPLLALSLGFFSSRKKILAAFVVVVIMVQLYTNVYSPFFLLFQLPKSWTYSVPKSVDWFKNNYDSGHILISANRHENFMFQTGLPYKDFIYEGSRNYWVTCLNDPSKYATWVIYDEYQQGDSVTVYLTHNAHLQLDAHYDLIYNVGGFKIYRLKDGFPTESQILSSK